MTTATFLPNSGAALESLRIFAERPENLYRLDGTGASVVPGDDPRFTREVEFTVVNPNVGRLSGTLRVVFSHTRTRHEGRPALVRHASFSLVAGDGRPGIPLHHGIEPEDDLPPPSAVHAVCLALGFEGGFRDWIVGRHAHESRGGASVIVVAQEIQPPRLSDTFAGGGRA